MEKSAFIYFVFFFFCLGLGFELRASQLQSRCSTAGATPPVRFALVILEMRVSRTICLSWPRTIILPISASQVARITGVSHQLLVTCFYFIFCSAGDQTEGLTHAGQL
jgi:hypothetical protein